MDEFMAAAHAEAEASVDEGGLPIGSVVVKDGAILGRGRNTLIQNGDPTGHAEMEAYRDAARNLLATRPPRELGDALAGATVYTTMMPCEMCTGAIIRFAAARVVVAETRTYADAGTAPLMESRGIAVEVRAEPECVALVEGYFERHPDDRDAWAQPRAPLLPE